MVVVVLVAVVVVVVVVVSVANVTGEVREEAEVEVCITGSEIAL